MSDGVRDSRIGEKPSKCMEESRAYQLRRARELMESARGVVLTPEQIEEQRRSFAYGNAKLEGETVTRDQVDEAAERIARKSKQDA